MGLSKALSLLCAERLCLGQSGSGEGHSCSFLGNWEHGSAWGGDWGGGDIGPLCLWELQLS